MVGEDATAVTVIGGVVFTKTVVCAVQPATEEPIAV
jgi:hypothetical protein